MSAYAFPAPIPSAESTPSVGLNSGSALGVQTSVLCPLHQLNNTSVLTEKKGLKAPEDLSMRKPFKSRYGKMDLNEDLCCRSEKTESETLLFPKIVVQEARIDSVQLIQSFTGSRLGRQQTQRPTRRNARDKRRKSSSDNSPSSRSTLTSKQIREQFIATHGEAIMFDLFITFNGREYNATRTLKSISQLRDDLNREIKWPKGIQVRRDANGYPGLNSQAAEVKSHYSMSTKCIPELPSIVEEGKRSGDSRAGFVVRDFTFLQSLAISYVSVLERWLHDVVAIVPQDSECLSNFLWEPVSRGSFAMESICSSFSTASTLGSIKELDYTTGDEDSDDEQMLAQ